MREKRGERVEKKERMVTKRKGRKGEEREMRKKGRLGFYIKKPYPMPVLWCLGSTFTPCPIAHMHLVCECKGAALAPST